MNNQAVLNKNTNAKEIKEIDVNKVVFRDDLYPRIEKSTSTVQKYAENLEVLPAIEVNQRHELIDGWHRWTAHKKAEAKNIKAIITHTNSDRELLELAIERNACHGLQLSLEDKRDLARKIYSAAEDKKRDEIKAKLVKLLSVSERTMRNWLASIDNDIKERRDKKILNMWLTCHTHEEIADVVGLSRSQVGEILTESVKLPKSAETTANHLVDFEVPLYNVLKIKEKSGSSSLLGNTEPEILDNLLYLYTKPFDVVVDPFAGGGNTIDICKKRFRRYWVSDCTVVPEREHEIRKWDITKGLPPLPRWQDVTLIYLDSSKWKQSANIPNSNAQVDTTKMPLNDFTENFSEFINSILKKLHPGAVIATLIPPTQWKSSDKLCTDYAAELIKKVKLPINMRFQCLYEGQQCAAQMVEWAKANKRPLVISSELIVWQIPNDTKTSGMTKNQ
ncbi:MAG: ParB/RepB/Spo0J family partition protein [Candidatus Brocadia sp.]|nr:ParB/RepB/Spo0J family partition protein [Candidatus Brocadia sp.]